MDYPFELGPWSRRVTAASSAAQAWFDRGLNWTYAYNHEEAVACFRQALKEDPSCAMAWWGIACAAGPFYNRPWIRYTDAEVAATLAVCREAIEQALALAGNADPAEQALVHALARRYRNRHDTDRAVLNRWQWDYADAMRDAAQRFGDDPDIAALYAEAAVTCTPRQLWDLTTGEPNPTARTHEVMPVLERWVRRIEHDGPVHPGILHMYIHALEMSPFPQRALKAADMLRGYAPDAGHLEHMPAHVYVLCGDYAQAVAQSERAVRADDKYLAFAGDANFYTTARCHNLHLFMYSAMFLGQYGKSLHAADRICRMATSDLIAASPPFMASILDGYSAMRTHVLIRFGRWADLVAMPAPDAPALRPIGTAMHAYARGVAYAALGRIDEAEAARLAFTQAAQAIPEDAIFLSNPVRVMLRIGEAMLDGELEYRKRNHDRAFASLRLAVERDDALNYTEPWAWMHPPRHALGALLAEQGRFEEAEAVYRTDLGYDQGIPRCCQHSDNIWALQGLAECLARSGDAGELRLLRQRLEFAKSRADVPIESSCFCRSACH
ncbi:MAG: tetratricopeptide repeat protein [Thalassobaculum sp.]|uniref:tetratricopeptide repeat protein n=1 Tax=Thalassobaculum sp. TaxID=2022740 RepID=UPI0032EF818A